MKRVNVRNLLTFNDAASYLEIGVEGLYVQSVKRPSWYVKIGKQAYVDISLYNSQRDLTAKCYEANTSYVYWELKELFVTDFAIAKWMSSKSNCYDSESSWKTFISVFFSVPLTNGVNLKRTLHSEFFKIGLLTLRAAIKRGHELRYFDKELFCN